MSVSATMAESWTVSRFAVLRITVQPPNVGLESAVRWGGARLHPGQHLALPHRVARLAGHLDARAPCIGLGAERESPLHPARAARGDDDVATRHRDCLIEGCRQGLLARGGAAHED